jgi:3-oxoadipate enol-lactonase
MGHAAPVSDTTIPSADGTRIHAWCNDGEGRPVLLCNGLGTPPEAWPSLTDPTCGFRVATWYQRGLGGSERPDDPERRRVEHHTEDALAVMEALDMPAALVVGWSLGVNVAFELVRQQPRRVDGVLAVAGVPGGSYESLFGPLGVPRALRPRAGRASAKLLRLFGPVLPLLTATLPAARSLPFGLLGPAREAAHGQALGAVLHAFAGHDWDWYHDLAVALGEHAPLDVSTAGVPVTVIAGSSDALVDVRDLRDLAARLGDAHYRELPGTHFLPLQYPEVMLAELRSLAVRADEARR